jgi:glycosyltransferase involved in cell wall biosynthesis
MRVINVLYYEQLEKGPGGSRVSLLNLIRGLGEHVQTFVVGNFPPDALSELLARSRILPPSRLWPPPAKSLFGRFGKTARWICYFLCTGLRLAAAIRRLHIDVVHGNNDVNSNAPAILAAMLTRRPYVGHLRGTLRPWWETRWLFNHVDHYIAITDDVKKYYEKQGLLDGKPVSVIFNGVDVDRLAQQAAAAARQKTDAAPRVAMFGRMDEFKGHEYFLRAAAELLRENTKIEFVVNGPVPGPGDSAFPYYRRLCEIMESLGIGRRVRFAGPYTDVAEVMGQTDVCVACSPHSNLGRILIEAMACGVPLVAFDCGGMHEAAAPEQNCLMAPNRDHVALAQAIARAASDGEIRERLIAQGRRTAARLFDFRANAQNILRIYEGLVAQSQATAAAHGTSLPEFPREANRHAS